MRRVIKLFERGNVQVFGLRGTGKDMLFGNVIARRKKRYISNVDYGGDHIKYDYKALDVRNTYENFLDGIINKYVYPYEPGVDVYLSDCGILFPSQHQGELCKRYKTMPTTLGLSRHTGQHNYHTNTQAIGRVWDKIREQSEIYLRCLSCKVIGGIVFQRIVVYDRYASAESCVPPFPLSRPLSRDKLIMWEMERTRYLITHGNVIPMTLVYFNRAKYDTHSFGEVLKNGS